MINYKGNKMKVSNNKIIKLTNAVNCALDYKMIIINFSYNPEDNSATFFTNSIKHDNVVLYFTGKTLKQLTRELANNFLFE